MYPMYRYVHPDPTSDDISHRLLLIVIVHVHGWLQRIGHLRLGEDDVAWQTADPASAVADRVLIGARHAAAVGPD